MDTGNETVLIASISCIIVM